MTSFLFDCCSVTKSCPTLWPQACQSSLSFTISWSLLKLMSIESVMPSNYLTLCRPHLLLPSIFPSIRVYSNELVLRIRWPKYWSFSFSISPSNEHPGLVSFRMDWLDLLAVQWTLKSLLHGSTPQFKSTSSLHVLQFFVIATSGVFSYYILATPDNNQFSSVAQSYPTLCNPMNCSTPGFPIFHYLLEFAQTHVHWVDDAIQPSHPLLPPSPPTFNLSQIRVFSNESVLHIKWPKYWSSSFSIRPSSEYSGLISFRMDWVDLLAVQGTLKSLLQHYSSKA